MKSMQQNNQIALGLMGCSLGLLAMFLLFWLYREYEQERSLLKEKSSSAFINSMKEAEFQFIKQDLLPLLINLRQPHHDSIQIEAIDLNIDKVIAQNSHKRLLIADSLTANLATQISISIQTDSSSNERQAGGTFFKWRFRTNLADSLSSVGQSINADSLTLLAIKKIVGGSPKIRDLPGYSNIVRMEDSTQNISSILSDPYKDLESGASFALSLEATEGYFLSRLFPQIGFSLFLFMITTLAFYFVYKSLLEQQQLTTLKNDLFGNITHELKTPISTAGVAIEALQNFGALKDPSKTQEYLGIAQQELQRLSLLVDKVLNTALFEQMEIPLHREPVDLKQLITTILRSMNLTFRELQAKVHFTPSGADYTIQGDKIHLTSVIYNLLDNALKYSPEKPDLQLQLVARNQQVHLSIQDKGIGIAKEYQPKVFDKFFRVPTGNEHTIKGHGLGLNYVQKVINKHGGNVEMNSELGKGTTITIILPT